MPIILLFLLLASPLAARKFYDDDPVIREPKPRTVDKAASRKLSDYYDLFLHQFGHPGERQPEKGEPIRARAINTLGDPMEGAWWEKRHYFKTMSPAELTQGPTYGKPPSMAGKWTVISAKSEGVTPGFVIVDSAKNGYFIKFDPLSNPEMATAADSISSRFFHALGYHTPANFLVSFPMEQLEIRPDVQLSDSTGRQRPMTRRDLFELLLRVPKDKNGNYRATASAGLPGRTIGPPRWFGTRADDVNDTVPHEHRRDLRGLHVIDAWLGHDDSRAINNVDVLSTQNGVQQIWHYQLDFGSTLGSATQKANSPRSGVYFFSWRESAKLLFSLGLYVPYWARAEYPNLPSVGRLEWKTFDPERWRPEYPNPAFQNRLPDDEFWAAKQVMAFTDADIKTIVATGQLSDPKATAWVEECLRERRNKVGRTYFAKVLPLDQFAVTDGQLTWVDLGQKHQMHAPATVQVQWSTFDNETERATALPNSTTRAIPNLAAGYSLAELVNPAKPTQRIRVYLRHRAGSATVVGVERTW